MEKKVLDIINVIRQNKGMEPLAIIQPNNNLRDDIGFTSFDLAELTVKVEDVFEVDIFENGLVNTIGEVYQKLS